jgi:hypothetical protein
MELLKMVMPNKDKKVLNRLAESSCMAILKAFVIIVRLFFNRSKIVDFGWVEEI